MILSKVTGVERELFAASYSINPHKSAAMNICLKNFPQLRLIGWNLRDGDILEAQEAFALYERNWRFVEQAQLLNHERELIENLCKEFGAGLMNA